MFKNFKLLFLTLIMFIFLSVSFISTISEGTKLKNIAHAENLTTHNIMDIPEYTAEEKKPETIQEVKAPKVVVAPVNDKEDGQKTNRQADKSTVRNIEKAKKQYETSGTSFGIDVSKHNGIIDWAKVKASGVDFAMIRVGYRGYVSGKVVVDPYFYRNINGALKNGIHVGVYFYSVAKDEIEAKEEALLTLQLIKNYPITYPVVYDLEDFDRYRLEGVSHEQLNKNAVVFLNTIRSAGYTPMHYGSKSKFGPVWNMGTLNNYKIWLAHYTDKTNYSGKYNMWQYTSSGSVPGINGRVDLNIAYFKLTTDIKYQAKDESEVSLDPNAVVIKSAGIKEDNDTLITTTKLNFRKSPTTELDNIISKIETSTEVKKIGISSDGKWAKIIYNNVEGYVSTSYLTKPKKEEPKVEENKVVEEPKEENKPEEEPTPTGEIIEETQE